MQIDFSSIRSIMHLLMEHSYLNQYLFIGIFLVFATLFGVFALLFAKIVAPKKPSAVKESTYECGFESKGEPWIKYHAQYYIFALIFIIFDIETIFIYPWAVAFKKLGLFAFIEMIIFIAILGFGLIYVWKKNILRWE